ncbi:MAG: LysM peptidoglycan-binding domain-containing M23 family metallopeptidase [Cyanobium sp. MAG06]|nr:LysM peptidoglycan-binding domain-containing M23 family metallopeptidase [Cyanobium sp. MAG06]
MKSKTVKTGELLLILPISGVQHTVKKGETIQSIAKKYNADIYEILEFNYINDDKDIKVGEDIIIPNAEIKSDTQKNKTNVVVKSYIDGRTPLKTKYYNNILNYFLRPVNSGIKTQGLHGRNAIDIGVPVGTPIVASADGTILLARNFGYNGGYGVYVIISHPNGTQTLYGHMSSLIVSTGQYVKQGQIIGYSGNSGRSTGPHLHFEIIGAYNPF